MWTTADLEHRLQEVMGDMTTLKKKYRKQSGNDEVPTEAMYRCAHLHQAMHCVCRPLQRHQVTCSWSVIQ
jgi:hypothetical protein